MKLSLPNKVIYPSVFRPIIGLLLLIHLLFLFPNIDVLFNQSDYTYSYELEFLRQHLSVFAFIYSIILVCFILGIGGNLMSFLVFIFYLLFLLIKMPLQDWGNFMLLYTLVFFVFVDAFKLLRIRLFSFTTSLTISYFGVIMIQLHLIYMYLISGFHKLFSPDWQEGVAAGFFFASAEVFDKYQVGKLLVNNRLVISVITYFTIFFQLSFLLVLFKIPNALKYTILIIGTFMHLGMAIILGFWQFELMVILHYGFFLTDNELLNIRKKFSIFAL